MVTYPHFSGCKSSEKSKSKSKKDRSKKFMLKYQDKSWTYHNFVSNRLQGARTITFGNCD